MPEAHAISAATDTTDATPMPEVKKRKYSPMFDSLPSDDMHCSAVDVNHGKWYKCNKCDKKVMARADRNRAFTLGRWKEHKDSVEHQISVAKHKHLNEIKLVEAAGAGKISKLQQQLLIQNQKNQTPLFAFFT